MSWAIIIELIIALMPFLLKWLEELFSSVAATMGNIPASKEIFSLELDEFFRRAEKKIPWYLFWRKPILRKVKKSVLARTNEFHAAAMDNANKAYITPLTVTESRELRESMGV